MAEKSIGELSAKVTANASGFNAGIDGAIKKAEAFHGHIGRMLSAPLAGVGSIAAAPGKAISAFVQPLQAALGSIPLVGAAFAGIPGSASAFMDWLGEGRQRILEQDKLARRLGVSMRDAATIQVMGGSRSEEFDKAISHFQRELGGLKMGDKAAEDKFRKAGLQPDQFKGLGTTAALKEYMDSVNQIGDASQRAAIDHEMLGKASEHVSDIFRKGSAGFEKYAAGVDKFGLAASQETLATIKENEALKKNLDLLKQGLQVSAAGALEPSAAMQRWHAASFLDIGAMLTNPVGMAWASKNIEERLAFAKSLTSHQMGQEKHEGEFAKQAELSKQVEATTKSLEAHADAIGRTAREAKNMDLAKQGAGGPEMELNKTLAAQLDALDKVSSAAVRGTGIFEQFHERVVALDKAFMKLDPAQHAAKFQELRKKLEEAKGAEGVKAFNETRTPLETFRSKMDELSKLGVDDKTKAGRTRQLWDQLTGGNKPGSVTAPRVEAGSNEAIEALARLNDTSRQDPTKNEMVALLKEVAAAENRKAVQDKALNANVVVAIKELGDLWGVAGLN